MPTLRANRSASKTHSYKLPDYVPKRLLRTALAGFLLLFFFSWGCTKIDTTSIGEELIPVVDNINTFDTVLDVLVNNFDSVDNDCVFVRLSDQHALGIISNDPLFGGSKASIYGEFEPDFFPFKVRDSLHLDSVVMVLAYTGTFGDSMVPQRVEVFPLLDSLRYDTSYSSCTSFAVDNSNPLGNITFTPYLLKDSVISSDERAVNRLRIQLDTTLFVALIGDSAKVQSDSAFSKNFKGFAVIPDETFGGNALNYFSLIDASTRVSFYYKSTKTSEDTTLVYNFPITNFNGHANTITRTRGSSEITTAVTHSPNGDPYVYLQTSPGSYAELRVPGLDSLSNRVIHRAELIAEQAPTPGGADETFSTPPILYLDTKDTSTVGKYYAVPCDFRPFSSVPDFAYLGGVRTYYTDGSGNTLSKYVFNVSRFVQSVLTRHENNPVFRLRAPFQIINNTAYYDRCGQAIQAFIFAANNVAQGRVKLYGNSGTPQKMRLHVIYSTF